jgi:GNAT superfamily N-acetyltransferase
MNQPSIDNMLGSKQISLTGPVMGKGQDCASIMRSLPDWFGIEVSIVKYSTEIDRLPTWLVFDRDRLAGFLSVKQHYHASAELLAMGVRSEWQRQGLGRELLRRAEEWLRGEGCEYLQVKTLGASSDDENYAGTRNFYQSMGFRPLEEFSRIWDEHNPCLIMVKRL